MEREVRARRDQQEVRREEEEEQNEIVESPAYGQVSTQLLLNFISPHPSSVNTPFFSQSYLDWLPSEIQQYISNFHASLYLEDLRVNPRKQFLLKELNEYSSLKKAWGLGYMYIKYTKNECDHCDQTHHVITGHYRDHYQLTEQKVFLGHSYGDAHFEN